MLEVVVDGAFHLHALGPLGRLNIRLKDEDVAVWHLLQMGTSKICDLSVSPLTMMKGNKSCSWLTHVGCHPCVPPTCCRCSLFSMLRSVACQWRGSRCAPARHLVHLAFVVVVRSGEFWWCSCSRRRCRRRPETMCLAYPSQDSSKCEWKKGKN